MNSRQKGNSAERGARDIYEAAGFSIDRVGSTAGGYRMTDAFGQVDIVALHPDRRVRVVQVKSNGASGVREFVEWAAATLPDAHATADYLVRHDGTNQHDPAKWRLLRRHDDGDRVTYRTVVDERKDGTPADGEGVLAWLRGENRENL